MLTRRTIVLLGLGGVSGRRRDRLHQAQHRGLSATCAGDHRNHRPASRLVGRGDGALLHNSDGSRDLRHAWYITAVNSTSFYGLSFLRVTFKYGVEFYFAQTQIEYSLQQNVSLPNNVVASDPAIEPGRRGRALRHGRAADFGLENLRTVQDWIVLRRLSTVPGVVQVNSFGGPTKEFEVESRPAKAPDLWRSRSRR